MKTQPIREGDKFKSASGEVWCVFEDMKFGRGYWVHSADRTRQTIFNRASLLRMERVA